MNQPSDNPMTADNQQEKAFIDEQSFRKAAERVNLLPTGMVKLDFMGQLAVVEKVIADTRIFGSSGMLEHCHTQQEMNQKIEKFNGKIAQILSKIDDQLISLSSSETTRDETQK